MENDSQEALTTQYGEKVTLLWISFGNIYDYLSAYKSKASEFAHIYKDH